MRFLIFKIQQLYPHDVCDSHRYLSIALVGRNSKEIKKIYENDNSLRGNHVINLAIMSYQDTYIGATTLCRFPIDTFSIYHPLNHNILPTDE